MASGSPETMTELFDGIEPVESKSLFPNFFHDALQERMGQVGSGDGEEIELSEGRGAIIHEKSLVFRNAGTRRQGDLSPPCRDPIKEQRPENPAEPWNAPEKRKEAKKEIVGVRLPGPAMVERADMRSGIRSISGRYPD